MVVAVHHEADRAQQAAAAADAGHRELDRLATRAPTGGAADERPAVLLPVVGGDAGVALHQRVATRRDEVRQVVAGELAQADALVGQRGVGQVEAQDRILSGVPGRAMRATRAMSLFRIRMHPLLAAVPISSGRLVPWMATRPLPPANSLSLSE